jgi:cobalt-zinc-cadmium efflux system outer membrane protein
MKYLGAIALLLLSVLPAEQFVSVFCGAQAFALEQRLTLNEAITLALQHHPLLTAAWQRIEAARGRLVSAKALPNPSLTAVPFGVPESKPLLLQQPVELPFKRTVRIKTAESEINAALADYRTVELDVIFAVKVAYVDLQAAVAVYRLTEEAVATAQTLHDLAQKQFTLGAVPFVHVTRTEIERQRIEQELV